MNAIKAIFIKQLNDVFKNPTVTMMFIMFPAMAFFMIEFMSDGTPGAAGMQVANMAIMSVAALPIMGIASYIAEDVENRSLRFLVMAGVKPAQYLIGLSSFIMILTLLSMAAFAFIGEFTGSNFGLFIGITMLGSLVSLAIGAVTGLLSKSVQQVNTYGTILMMGLGFLPMMVMFNPDVLNFSYYLFTQQVSLVLIYLALGGGEVATAFFTDILAIDGINVMRSMLIILANAAVFAGLFAFIYKKKGLRGE